MVHTNRFRRVRSARLTATRQRQARPYQPHEWPAMVGRIRSRDPELARVLAADISELIACAEDATP